MYWKVRSGWERIFVVSGGSMEKSVYLIAYAPELRFSAQNDPLLASLSQRLGRMVEANGLPFLAHDATGPALVIIHRCLLHERREPEYVEALCAEGFDPANIGPFLRRLPHGAFLVVHPSVCTKMMRSRVTPGSIVELTLRPMRRPVRRA